MPDQTFTKMLSGYSLTTAEILYHMPDHPSLLQSFLWQDYDLHPKFPRLKQFLDFWAYNLDGRLSHIFVAHSELVRPAQFRLIDGEFRTE